MNALKKLREAKKLSQTELAAKVGVSQRYIAFIEKGDRTPSLGNALRIANIIGCQVEDIFLNSKCTKSTSSL